MDGGVDTPKPGFVVVRRSITHTTGSRGAGLQLHVAREELLLKSLQLLLALHEIVAHI